MFSNTVVTLVISLYAVEILAVDDNCPTPIPPYEHSPIENCCDLKQKSSEFTFGEFITNKPNVYKLKNFCNKTCSTLIINGYCDTITDGGGWLVVQRRTNGSESFHRNWNDYEKGFGSLTGELWYGLRALHCLTSSGNWELRIDFTFSNGTKSFIHYNHFRVGPATDNYRLSISGFTGIAPTDPFTTLNINGQQFSTLDRDNDKDSNRHCALKSYGSTAPGGWWHKNCFNINLNYSYRARNEFILLANKWYSPPFIEMKIRTSKCKI